MHNLKQLDHKIFQLVLEGKSPEDVFREFRNVQAVHDILGNESTNDFKKRLEGAAKQAGDAIKEAKRQGPMIERHLLILQEVTGLTGEVIQAIAQVDLGEDYDPRDVRDAIQLLQTLEKQPNEIVLEKAINWLEEAGLDVSSLEDRYNKLFPKADTTNDES